MSVFNDGKMDRMRADAIRRSQEMYRKSGGNIEQPLPAVSESAEKPLVISEKKSSDINSILNDILGNGIETDRLLIIALLFLLIKEGADIKLIIALGYILL